MNEPLPRSVERTVDESSNEQATSQIPDPRSQIPEDQKPKPEAKKNPPYPPGFESFWSAYPRKRGKAAALKVWKRLNPTNGLGSNIVAAVFEQVEARHFQGNDGQDYIKDPAAWLNQGCWEDEISRPETTRERIDRIMDAREEQDGTT